MNQNRSELPLFAPTSMKRLVHDGPAVPDEEATKDAAGMLERHEEREHRTAVPGMGGAPAAGDDVSTQAARVGLPCVCPLEVRVVPCDHVTQYGMFAEGEGEASSDERGEGESEELSEEELSEEEVSAEEESEEMDDADEEEGEEGEGGEGEEWRMR